MSEPRMPTVEGAEEMAAHLRLRSCPFKDANPVDVDQPCPTCGMSGRLGAPDHCVDSGDYDPAGALLAMATTIEALRAENEAMRGVVDAARLDLADAQHQCGGDGERCDAYKPYSPRRCPECPMDTLATTADALAVLDATGRASGSGTRDEP